jgi:GNAT superfamily N-acetyltransferase
MTAVRAARLEDASAIAEMSGELGYPATPELVERRLALLLADRSQCVLVAEHADRGIIGWAHAAEQVVLESGTRCELLGLVVTAAERGAGAGRALVSAVEAWAAARGIPVVSLRCNIIRSTAHAFYAELGYEAAKTQLAFRKRLDTSEPAGPMA